MLHSLQSNVSHSAVTAAKVRQSATRAAATLSPLFFDCFNCRKRLSAARKRLEASLIARFHIHYCCTPLSMHLVDTLVLHVFLQVRETKKALANQA